MYDLQCVGLAILSPLVAGWHGTDTRSAAADQPMPSIRNFDGANVSVRRSDGVGQSGLISLGGGQGKRPIGNPRDNNRHLAGRGSTW
jgi:hypothetical protein